ncbi:MAG: hypothetical protein WCT99_13200 [Bacteroidota bacterium]
MKIFDSMKKIFSEAVRRLLPSCALFFVLGTIAGCEDVLPVYQEPENILSAHIGGIDSVNVNVRLGFYDENILLSQDPFPYRYYVSNDYDETIQNSATIAGKVEIWPTSDPTAKGTTNISLSDLSATQSYNSATGMLTIDPNEMLWFTGTMTIKLDNGFLLTKYAHEQSRTIVWQNSSNYYDIYYSPLSVTIRVSVQLYDKIAPVVADSTFMIQFHAMIMIPKG